MTVCPPYGRSQVLQRAASCAKGGAIRRQAALPVMAWGATPTETALKQCDQLILAQVEPGEAQVEPGEAQVEPGEARFGPVPAAVEARVGQLADLPLLSAQHRRVVVVESLEVFAQELAAVWLGPG